jgi:hypothetical protein
LVGAKLFTYLAGSTTKVTVYKNSSGSSSHTNPIVLDANGRPASPVFLLSGQTYKFVLAPSNDTDPPGSPYYTWDNVSAINDVTAPAQDEWVSGPTPTYVSATQFTVAGDQTSLFQVNRRIKAIIGAGTVYGYISVSAFGALTTVTVVLDSGTLDSGLTAVSYALLSATNPSYPSNVVTLAGTQILTNKTLTSPAITTPVITSATGIGQALVKRKTADESVTSSTALQNDDHLTFAIAANEEWTAFFSIDGGDNLVTTGLNFAVTVPAGATLDARATCSQSDSTGTLSGNSTASASVLWSPTVFGGLKFHITGALWVLNGANAGSVTIQWAQGSSSLTALTLKKGSSLVAYRIA